MGNHPGYWQFQRERYERDHPERPPREAREPTAKERFVSSLHHLSDSELRELKVSLERQIEERRRATEQEANRRRELQAAAELKRQEEERLRAEELRKEEQRREEETRQQEEAPQQEALERQQLQETLEQCQNRIGEARCNRLHLMDRSSLTPDEQAYMNAFHALYFTVKVGPVYEATPLIARIERIPVAFATRREPELVVPPALARGPIFSDLNDNVRLEAVGDEISRRNGQRGVFTRLLQKLRFW